MEGQRYSTIFRERWYVVILVGIIGVLVALGIGRITPPQYEATATLFLSVQSDQATQLESSQYSLARVQSYAPLVTSPDVLRTTISDLRLPLTERELAADVTANNPTGTVLLEVTADYGDRAVAADIANAVANNAATKIEKLENAADNTRYDTRLDLTIPATVPSTPVSPKIPILLGLGLIGGLALGAVAAIALAAVDPRVRTRAEVRSVVGLPVIGELPWRLRKGDAAPRGALRDALERAFLAVRALGSAGPQLLVLVPVGVAGAAALQRDWADVLHAMGRRVCIVDGGDPRPGAAQVLAGKVPLSEVLDRRDGVATLPIGLATGAPLKESRVPALIRPLLREFDVVIVVASPAERRIPFAAVARLGLAILVLDSHRTLRRDLIRVTTSAELAGITPVGAVLLGVTGGGQRDLSDSWLPSDVRDPAEGEEPQEPMRRRPAPKSARLSSVARDVDNEEFAGEDRAG